MCGSSVGEQPAEGRAARRRPRITRKTTPIDLPPPTRSGAGARAPKRKVVLADVAATVDPSTGSAAGHVRRCSSPHSAGSSCDGGRSASDFECASDGGAEDVAGLLPSTRLTLNAALSAFSGAGPMTTEDQQRLAAAEACEVGDSSAGTVSGLGDRAAKARKALGFDVGRLSERKSAELVDDVREFFKTAEPPLR